MVCLNIVHRALIHEPESWIAYLYGQHPTYVQGLTKRGPRRMLLFRLAAYGWSVLRVIRMKPEFSNNGLVDVLVFAETANQAHSLAQTIHGLREKGLTVRIITANAASAVLADVSHFSSGRVTLNLNDLMKLIALNLIRLPKILEMIRRQDGKFPKEFVDQLFKCHIYHVFFDKVISLTNPRLVLMSNDHNVPQRSLLSIAKVRGIKSAYVQHASVSSMFPKLSFNYCFLDGQVAKNTYESCELNGPKTEIIPANRYVFLTGQKKPVRTNFIAKPLVIGLAINELDDVNDVIRIINLMTENHLKVRLRWHPGTGFRKAGAIRRLCLKLPSVSISDPHYETVGKFIGKIGVLIAGNSSIHLEAAIGNILPIYFDMSRASVYDYYGYVKNGLSVEAKDESELLGLVGSALNGELKLNTSAVRSYSATFETEWAGYEGKLTAAIIKRLLDGAYPGNCWGYVGIMDRSPRAKMIQTEF